MFKTIYFINETFACNSICQDFGHDSKEAGSGLFLRLTLCFNYITINPER
jgi:hypothetical protein